MKRDFAILCVLICGCSAKIQVETRPTDTNTVFQGSHKSDWEQGYELGHERGIEVGMVTAYCFMGTGPNFTNYLDFKVQAMQWGSNATKLYKQVHPQQKENK